MHWLPLRAAGPTRLDARQGIYALFAGVLSPLGCSIRRAVTRTGTDSLRLLIATLIMPMILALPIGKAFSKPDFWSTDLALPGVIAVRPMTSVEIVATKMKVAALS